MEIPRAESSDSPCLDKFQREAFLCLNTFPEKVTELNILIDEHTPRAIKKSRGNVTHQPSPSCLSISSTTPGYYYHDVRSCYSATPYKDRCKSRKGICKRKYRRYLRRRSRPLAQILAILVNRLAVCTRAMFIGPSKYIIGSVTAMFLQREQMKHVQCGTSTAVCNAMNCKENCSVVNSLICTMRPAAVRLIADTTILKRWLQALALGPTPTNQSLSQAIRTTETIDGWAYELFFHLKYLQVINFPCDVVQDNGRKLANEKQELTALNTARFPASDLNFTDEVMHTNLWHRIVQLRDNYMILFETLRSNGQFIESDADSENLCPAVIH